MDQMLSTEPLLAGYAIHLFLVLFFLVHLGHHLFQTRLLFVLFGAFSVSISSGCLGCEGEGALALLTLRREVLAWFVLVDWS